MIVLWLLLVIVFIVLATARLKWHPFLVLILACFLTAFCYGLPAAGIAKTIGTGFGGILGSIGLVIVLGTIIGLVIGVGLLVAVVPIVAGWLWANRFLHEQPDGLVSNPADDARAQAIRDSYGEPLPPALAFMPIVVPIVLICLGSVAAFPTHPFGDGAVAQVFNFFGTPLNALLIGTFLSFTLIRGEDKTARISAIIGNGLTVSAPILLITGAGGAFGAILKETPVSSYLGSALSSSGVGIFMPFIVAAALKSAQGSTTVALVTASSIVAPLLGQMGLDSEMGRVLCLMAIGAGAMTVSHANDSFFWVVTQFSRMSVGQGYRTQTAATAIQGISGIFWIWLLAWVML